jgi:glycosyltransferase involved in cell wall biosynthesis
VRVAYDHQIFQLQEYGGISRYLVELARIISGSPGISVKIVCPLYINAYLAEASGTLPVFGRHVPPVRYTGRIKQRVNNWLTPQLLSHFHPDLVHETYYSTQRVSPVGAKTVLTVHDMIHDLFPDWFPPGWAASESASKRTAVERADHLICVSENTRKDLLDLYGVDSAKTSVVHHGIPLIGDKPLVDDTPKRPSILYVGDRGAHKNFATLLAAYASSRSLQEQCDIVAFGGGRFTPQENALIDHLGVRRERIRHESGSDSDLALAYRRATLFVYPSRYEGFGIPLLEAMNLACPVICSNAGALPEVVNDAALLFEPDSASDLSNAIERLLGDTDLRRSLVERGRERVRQFSWERCAQETLDIYQRLL